MNIYRAEYTGTLGPEREANCSWVKECYVVAKDSKGAIRKVKEKFGLSGVRCQKENHGDSWALFPSGMARRVDIYHEQTYRRIDKILYDSLKTASRALFEGTGTQDALAEASRVIRMYEGLNK